MTAQRSFGAEVEAAMVGSAPCRNTRRTRNFDVVFMNNYFAKASKAFANSSSFCVVIVCPFAAGVLIYPE